MTDRIRPTYSFSEDKLADVRAVIPEAFEDGRVNWETLREALGDYLTDAETADEHFGLNWPGKRAARRLAAKPSHGTLIPVPGEGINEETTGNLFLEGDNLEVLKLLQKSYPGRIKMIYIDPPYNTGNDYVYKDDYSEPLDDYLRRSGQTGEKGELLTSNPKSSGRYHTNWLNMIYPRLRVARTLLADDGVIFVSIDDNEVHNLRAVMNEIFGEENFVAAIVWQKVFAKKNKAIISGSHDYVLVYSRQLASWARKLFPRDEEQLKAFSNPDNDPRGDWQSVAFSVQSEDSERRKAYRYGITIPSGREVFPPTGRHWNGLPERCKDLRDDNRLWFGADGDNPPRMKVFLSEVQEGIVPDTWWRHEDTGNNQEAKKEVLELFQNEEPFSTPKPTRLIRRLLQIAVDRNNHDIILDFFAGSATTADAVIQANCEDHGNRQFILVQIPEPIDDPSFPTISEISKERIRRVVAKKNAEPQKALGTGQSPVDLGFKVFKLGPSNFNAWRDYEGDDLNAIQNLFDEQETPLVDGWTLSGLRTEVMLLEGFPLDSKLQTLPEFVHNEITVVSSPTCGHRLWVCFDSKIQEPTLDALSLNDGDRFICLDSAIDDNTKIRLTQAGTLKTI